MKRYKISGVAIVDGLGYLAGTISASDLKVLIVQKSQAKVKQ